jgi:hypothetical protein
MHKQARRPPQQQRPRPTVLYTRTDPDLVMDVDRWRGRQFPIPSRTRAITELLRLALRSEQEVAA